jgi:hypothetical protein
MKLERSKAWWMAKAATEGDGLIAAGAQDLQPSIEEAPGRSETPESVAGVGSISASVTDETHVAFGRFVNLMRRRRGLTIDAFAKDVQIDASELLIIEDDVRYGLSIGVGLWRASSATAAIGWTRRDEGRNAPIRGSAIRCQRRPCEAALQRREGSARNIRRRPE